jgi:hypothetical protein
MTFPSLVVQRFARVLQIVCCIVVGTSACRRGGSTRVLKFLHFRVSLNSLHTCLAMSSYRNSSTMAITLMILLFHYCSQEARKERRQANKRNREEDVEAIIVENLSTAIIDNPYINNRVRRWRKCATVADDFAEHLHSLRAGLTVEKKKDVL